MALNPTTQDKRGILERNFNGRFDSRWPSGDRPPPEGDTLVTVTGSGFGVEPNVVFYRDFDQYEIGESIDLGVKTSEGEIGEIFECNMKVVEMYGQKVAEGFDGGQRSLRASFTQNVKRFDITHTLAVPVGRHMPGRDNTGLETPSGDSGWKPVWLLHQEGSNSSDAEPDLCVPSHIGGGAFRTSGNAVAMTAGWWGYQGDINDHWDWSGLNVFNYVQECGADPFTDIVTQRLFFTSAVTNGPDTNKPNGTKIMEYQRPGFPRGGENITVETASYRNIHMNTYARMSADSPELTQAGYTNIYVAGESSDGANDYKQKVFLGNASTLENCTLIKPKVASFWSDGEVRVICTGIEQQWATHVFVRKPDMTHEVKEILE